MKINEDEEKDELKEKLNEMENLFSELIIGLVEDAIVKDLQNNIDEKEKDNILTQREVEDNIKDLNQNYLKGIKRKHHYTIEDK